MCEVQFAVRMAAVSIS